MKRIFSLCALMLALAGLLSCASSPARRPSGSSVWKISSGDNALFLSGSIHILREADFPLPQEFDRAFALSDVLVLETDIEEMADESIATYMMLQMVLPDNQTLQSVLEPQTYEMLEAECNQYGFSLSIPEIARFKPSVITTMLAVFQIQKYGYIQMGVDIYYLSMAQQANKPLAFLETVETQINALVSMGDGYEDEFVRYSLSDLDNTEQELAALVSEWEKGGSAITEKMLAEMKEQWPQIYQTMMTSRNAAWMPQIEEFLASDQVYFIVVGLMHLHGPDGLLQQLREAGYSVEQIR